MTGLYRQALVLHEVFDDSRVSPRMEAVLNNMRRGRRPLSLDPPIDLGVVVV
jgi:hypothetical protein